MSSPGEPGCSGQGETETRVCRRHFCKQTLASVRAGSFTVPGAICAAERLPLPVIGDMDPTTAGSDAQLSARFDACLPGAKLVTHSARAGAGI